MGSILTTDGLITIQNKKIVLIKRIKEPFLDKLVMPGGHVDAGDASVAGACARELEEEIGLKINFQDLKLFTILDYPNRDPRPGKRISIVYRVDLKEEPVLKAGTDAKEVIVKNLDELTENEIGFDHWQAIKVIRNKVIAN